METQTLAPPAPDVAAPPPARGARHERSSESRLYRVVWRWHFYAGLFVAPVLLVAAITGGLYVFAEEIDAAMYGDTFFVAPPPGDAAERVSFERQVAAAQAVAAEGEHPSALQYADDDPTRATAVEFHTADERHRYVYVNPYTGTVTGQQIYEGGLMAVVLDIHRTLLAGTAGRIVVELATGWGLILTITGIYLWWPRRREKVKGVWTLRLKTKPYTLMRDLHTVPGFYVSILAAIVLLTGLVFSYFFGQGFQLAQVATGSFPSQFDSPPQSTVVDGGPASIDRVVDAVRAEGLHPRVYLAFPEAPTDSYVAYIGDAASPTTRAVAWVDSGTAAVVSKSTWADASAMFKASVLAYPLHVGSIYGLTTKILAVLVCVLIAAMTVTGVVMWWMRRPAKRTGFPRKPVGRSHPAWLVGVIVVLAVLVPTVGLTILALLAWDLVTYAGRRLLRGPKPAV